MKFGQYLLAQARAEWREHYVDYRALKKLIRDSVRQECSAVGSPRAASLSVVRASGLVAEEQFQLRMDDEMEKVGDFTQSVVVQLRAKLKSLAARLSRGSDPRTILQGVRQVDAELLALEKYTVLNYMACHKILKKHDRLCPNHATQHFMLHHLHRKPWVNGYFRDLLPQVSALYTRLKAHPETGNPVASPVARTSAQGYVYHTRSFWVTAEDLPVVRHHIMQNVPIHAPPGEPPQSDEEYHSLYLDNSLMELYHNRLYDRPSAATLKLTWRGDRAPEWVDLERCTYKESWKREPPRLESLPLKYSELHNFITGAYSYVAALDDLEGGRGVSDAHQCASYQKLHSSIQAMVNSKQLLPVVRVRSYRTTFQAAEEARIRATLDGELMYCPEEELGGQVVEQLAFSWSEGSGDSSGHTSPSPTRPPTWFRKLPYAVLQVTMFLRDGEAQPHWLQDLWEAGYLSEIFEWSPFLHAAAELYPHTLRALPYWIDDPGLKAARERQAARFARARAALATAATPASPPKLARTSRGSLRELWSGGSGGGWGGGSGGMGGNSGGWGGNGGSAGATPPRSPLRLAPHDAAGSSGAAALLQRIMSLGSDRGDGSGSGNHIGNGSGSGLDRRGGAAAPDGGTPSGTGTLPKPGGPLRPRQPLRIANYEPTAFLQNERVFNSWLMMAVQTAGIATAMLGFGATAYKDPLWDRQPIHVVTTISLILLPISVLMCAYAVAIFAWRRRCIRLNQWERFHDQLGPPLLALIIALAMTAIMCLSIADWWNTHQTKAQHKHRRSPAHSPGRHAPSPLPQQLIGRLLAPT